MASSRSDFVDISREYDQTMKNHLVKLRARFKKQPAWLDKGLPAIPFSPAIPARFAFVHLMRDLIIDSGIQFRAGDAMDIGTRCTLQVPLRILQLSISSGKDGLKTYPKPNRNPRVYYEPELENMVTDLESALIQLRTSPKGAMINLPLRPATLLPR